MKQCLLGFPGVDFGHGVSRKWMTYLPFRRSRWHRRWHHRAFLKCHAGIPPFRGALSEEPLAQGGGGS